MTRTNRWDGGDDFTELELVQNGGFTSSIKTNLDTDRVHIE